MRKLTRPEAPDCLQQNAATWNQDFAAVRKINPKHAFSWRSATCYQQLRERLAEMTQTHCAFCDGQLGTESRETVEHFRPKGVFPDQAFEWSNLFPCCDVCQSAKLEKFDPALLKPDESSYASGHYFLANYKTGQLDILPSAAAADQQRAEISIELYGLNLAARNKARLREWEHYQRDPTPELDDYNYRYFLE